MPRRLRQPTRRPANAGKHYPAEILTPEEVKDLILSCSNRAPTGIRNRASCPTCTVLRGCWTTPGGIGPTGSGASGPGAAPAAGT